MSKIIYVDMDGTLADTYRIPKWLERLEAHDATLFSEPKPADKDKVFNLINKFEGEVVVLTMLPEHDLSDDSKDEYYKQVKKAKIDWLAEHFPEFEEVVFVEYHESKADLYNEGDVLIDDSIRQLIAWPGIAIKSDWSMPLDESLKNMGREGER